jgi:hypothetical protein
MKKKMITIAVLSLFLSAGIIYATGDLTVMGKLGVGTSTPDQKLVVDNGLIKTYGTYGNQGFVSDLDPQSPDDSTATSLVSGLERATFLFSMCQGCSNGFHSFAIQARPRSDVLIGKPHINGTVFEIKESGMASIGKPEPGAWLDVSASGLAGTDYLRLSSDDNTNGDIMIVTSSGDVGIGTTSPGPYKLNINGSVYAMSYDTPSDMRLKDNINKIDSPLDKIKKLNGVSFSWKDGIFPAASGNKHFGVISQDVEKILPEIVTEGPDGMKSVTYSEIIPVLIEAVKEQQAMLERQQKIINELKNKI